MICNTFPVLHSQAEEPTIMIGGAISDISNCPVSLNHMPTVALIIVCVRTGCLAAGKPRRKHNSLSG